MPIVRTFALLSAIVCLTGCRTVTHTESASTDRVAVVRDTVRLFSARVDTVRDSVSVYVESDRRGDTIYKTVQKLVWRDRVSIKRDTVWRVKTDTLHVAERVQATTTIQKTGGVPTLFKIFSVLTSMAVLYIIYRRIK